MMHVPSYRAEAVPLLSWLAVNLGISANIRMICSRGSDPTTFEAGRILTTWAINRVLDPASAIHLELWTPTTDLPLLAKIRPEEFTKAAFLHALDAICYDHPTRTKVVDHVPELEEAMSRL